METAATERGRLGSLAAVRGGLYFLVLSLFWNENWVFSSGAVVNVTCQVLPVTLGRACLEAGAAVFSFKENCV